LHILYFSISTPPTSHSTILSFYNDPATTQIYTLSLHDALPISAKNASNGIRVSSDKLALNSGNDQNVNGPSHPSDAGSTKLNDGDRKSTRLNSSHRTISYAVFCLKKKKKIKRSK